jgi:hypothetical protein
MGSDIVELTVVPTRAFMQPRFVFSRTQDGKVEALIQDGRGWARPRAFLYLFSHKVRYRFDESILSVPQRGLPILLTQYEALAPVSDSSSGKIQARVRSQDLVMVQSGQVFFRERRSGLKADIPDDFHRFINADTLNRLPTRAQLQDSYPALTSIEASVTLELEKDFLQT